MIEIKKHFNKEIKKTNAQLLGKPIYVNTLLLQRTSLLFKLHWGHNIALIQSRCESTNSSQPLQMLLALMTHIATLL